jgi:hypothetical protein
MNEEAYIEIEDIFMKIEEIVGSKQQIKII